MLNDACKFDKMRRLEFEYTFLTAIIFSVCKFSR